MVGVRFGFEQLSLSPRNKNRSPTLIPFPLPWFGLTIVFLWWCQILDANTVLIFYAFAFVSWLQPLFGNWAPQISVPLSILLSEDANFWLLFSQISDFCRLPCSGPLLHLDLVCASISYICSSTVTRTCWEACHAWANGLKGACHSTQNSKPGRSDPFQRPKKRAMYFPFPSFLLLACSLIIQPLVFLTYFFSLLNEKTEHLPLMLKKI